jgi:hypothetical protein
MAEQVGPTPSILIAGRHHRGGQRPADREVGVVIGYRQVLEWVVRSIDPVTHIGAVGQRLEPVKEAGRYVQVPEIAVVQQEDIVLAERGRISSYVDQNVVHGAVGAPNQLGFTTSGTPVHAADHSLPGTGLGVLNERGGACRPTDVVVKNRGVESPCEQAAPIAERLRDKDEHVCEGRLFDTHLEMLA